MNNSPFNIWKLAFFFIVFSNIIFHSSASLLLLLILFFIFLYVYCFLSFAFNIFADNHIRDLVTHTTANYMLLNNLLAQIQSILGHLAKLTNFLVNLNNF